MWREHDTGLTIGSDLALSLALSLSTFLSFTFHTLLRSPSHLSYSCNTRNMAKEDPTKLVLVEKRGTTTIITINRPHKRNCVNGPTARALYQAFLDFDADSKVLHSGFCFALVVLSLSSPSESYCPSFLVVQLLGCCGYLDRCRYGSSSQLRNTILVTQMYTDNDPWLDFSLLPPMAQAATFVPVQVKDYTILAVNFSFPRFFIVPNISFMVFKHFHKT